MTSHNETRPFADLVADLANRKSCAARARFAALPLGAGTVGQESPRSVYLAACANIGLYLAEFYGFNYSKSRQHARRKYGQFSFKISFHYDVFNVQRFGFGFGVSCSVYSPKIKKFRESWPQLMGSDLVAGGQIGHLQEPRSWMVWDLTDEVTREKVTWDALQTIENFAFPYSPNSKTSPPWLKSL